jgi:alpha-beta hydrolase superfamily lysophospholipase
MAEPLTSRRLAVDGIHLHVRTGAAAPPVLLLHGFAETGNM